MQIRNRKMTPPNQIRLALRQLAVGSRLVPAALALTLLFAAAASAQTYTNTASGNWSVSGSWTGSVPPTGGTNTAIIQFSPTATDNSTNNLGGTFRLNQMRLTAAQAVNLSGSALLFTNNGATLPQINNSSTKTLTINSAITLATNLIFSIGSSSGAITLNNPVTDGGVGYSLTLNGAGTLTLAGVNTYSGGTFISGGTVTTTSATPQSNLGGTGANLTFNGSATYNQAYGATATFGSLAINGVGTTAVFNSGSGSGNSITFTGPATGNGTLNPNSYSGGYAMTFNLNSTANTFTGPIVLGSTQTTPFNANSLGDSSGAGSIQLGATTVAGNFNYGTGAIAPLTLNYRQIALVGTTGGATLQNNNTTQAITINTPLLVSGVGAKTLTLSAVAGPTNVWGGNIVDGSGTSYISLNKTGAGLWVLGGTNTYSGATTISAGTLTIGGAGTLGSGNYVGSIVNNSVLNYASSAAQTLFGVISGTGSLTNTGSGALLINGNAAGLTNVVTVAANATLGGSGILGGKVKYQNGSRAAFTITPTGIGYSNSTYLTFTNSVFITNLIVGVSMPAGLLNGTYVLATNYVAPTVSGGFTFVTNSGSLGTGGNGIVSMSGNNLILTVSGGSGAGYPTLTGATNFVNPFVTTFGTPSAPQTYLVLGGYLAANITNTAASGFEVSVDGVNYGSTAIITNTGGSASGTVFIRLAATALVGTYNSSNIVVLSTTPAFGNINITNTSSASGNVVYQQASSYWTPNAGAAWATNAYWSGGAPPLITGFALFTNATATYAPSVTTSNAVGALIFSNATTFGAGNSTLSISNAFPGSVGILVDTNAGLVDLGSANVALLDNQAWVNNSTNNLTVRGGIDSNGFNMTNTGPGTITQSGILSDTGGVVVNGGTLNLNGANTFTGVLTSYYDDGLGYTVITTNTGGVTLNGGTLSLGNAQALGNGAPVTINGGTLDASANLTLANNAGPQFWNGDFTFAGTTNLNLGAAVVNLGGNRTITVNSNILTIASQINDYLDGLDYYQGDGYYGLTVNGAGTLALASANDFYGSIVVNAPATLAVSAGGSVLGHSGVLTLNGGTLDFNASSGQTYTADLFVNSNATVICELNAPGAGVTYSLGELTFNSANTLTVSGGNTTSGNPGLTFVGGAGGYAMQLSGAATINFTNPMTSGATVFTASSEVSLGSYNLTFAGNGVVSFQNSSAVVTGTGGITVNLVNGGYLEFGWETLSGAVSSQPTYTGPTIVNSGAIWYTQYLPPGNITLNGGYLYDYYASTFKRTLGSGQGQFQILGGVSGWSDSGAGYTITLNGSVSTNVMWGSTNFNPAALLLQSSIGSGVLTFANSIDLNGTNRTVEVDCASSSGNAIISGPITNSSGTAGLIKSGSGTLVLTVANTYNGLTTISNGILQLTSATALQNSALDCANSIAGDAADGLQATNINTLTLGGLVGSRNLAAVFTTTFGGYSGLTNLTLNLGAGASNFYSGNIANGAVGMKLTKTGAGKQILAGTNTYTGTTTVSAGTLLVNGNSAGVTNTVTVQTNTTFGGTGVMGGKVTYQNGALANFIVTPEASDTYSNSTYMTFTNSLVFATNTTVLVDMPAGLGIGVYVLATNYVTPTVNGSLTFAANSGSLATNSSGSISVSGKNLILTVGLASTNAYLTNLVVSAGTLNPGFTSNTFVYSVSVPYVTTNLTLTPTAANTNTTITVNGSPVVSGNPSGAISLSVGANVITNLVVSQSATVTNIYTVTVTRAAAGTNAYLASLATSIDPLNPTFATNTFSYTNNVNFVVGNLTLTPTAADTNASIYVNGTLVASGNTSGIINLNVGTNIISVTVVAQSLMATNTYALTVIRGGTVSWWWDGGAANISTNGDGVSAGGGGIWDPSITNWDRGSGQSHAAWSNTAPSIAIFGGATGIVTNTNSLTVGGLIFTNTYTLTNGPGATLSFAGAGTISNSAAVTIATPLAGTGPITKTGAGTLTLSASNTFTGDMIINGGTVTLGSPFAWPAGKNLTFTGNGTFTPYNASAAPNNNPTMGQLTVNSGVTATMLPSTGNNLYFASLTGNGQLIWGNGSGGSTLTISNATTFTGIIMTASGSSSSPTVKFGGVSDASGCSNLLFGYTTLISQATFSLFNDVGPLTFNHRQIAMTNCASPATLDNSNVNTNNVWVINTALTNTSTAAKTLQLQGSNTGTNTFAGVISDGIGGSAALSVIKAAAGTWLLSANNTFTGSLTVNGGTLTLSGTNQYTGATAFSGNGSLIVNSIKNFGVASSIGKPASGDISFTQFGTSMNLIYVGSGDTANRTIQLNGYSISDAPAGTILNNGTGPLIFSASTFNSYGSTASRKVTLNLGGTYTGGINQIQGAIQNYNSNVADTLLLTKNNDASTWVLSGTNTYTGATTVGGGTLLVNGNNAGATGTVTITNGATFGGTGIIGGVVRYTTNGGLANAAFTITPAGTAYTNSTYMRFTNAVFMTNVTVGVSMPVGLTNGVYVLATNYVGFTTNGSLTFVTNSGSLGVGGSGQVSVSGNNLVLTVTNASSAPIIIGMTNFTAAFSTTYGTASAAQSYPVLGGNLTANITNTAATGFELSSDGVTYGSTLVVTNVGGYASGTVYIRLMTNAAAGSYNSANVVVLSSAGATSVTNTSSASGNTVAMANASFTVTPYSVTYDGLGHTASVSGITGVNGETGATVGVINLSGTTHTNALIYNSDTWSFAGTANYNSIGSAPITNVIAKATTTVTLAVNNTPVTCNGSGQAATVSVTASNTPGSVQNILTGGQVAQTNVGSYTVTANYVPFNTNYSTVTGATATNNFVITQGVSIWSYSNIGPFTYSGTAKTPTISFSGSTGLKTTNYVGAGATTYASVNAPTNAGTYYVSNTVVADSNYFGATNSQAFTISGASTPVKFTGISVSGTGLTLSVTNGTPNGPWILLQSTNLLLPVSQWPTNRTGNYDGSGNLTTNILNAATNPQAFYLLK